MIIGLASSGVVSVIASIVLSSMRSVVVGGTSSVVTSVVKPISVVGSVEASVASVVPKSSGLSFGFLGLSALVEFPDEVMFPGVF